jgi:hypothetical protein
VVVSLLVCFLLVEGVARWHLAQKQADWARLMQDERHYLRRSDDPRFGYEHDPGRVVESGGRRLAINAHGIRADSDELFPDRERIGLLGDSVTFGVLATQELTLAARLEETLAARGRDAAIIVRYARGRDLPLAVVLLPSRFAYRGENYLLEDQYAEIQRFLAARDVVSVFPRAAFGADPGGYLDRTDHLAAAGDRLMTEVLADLVESWAPLPE